MAFWTPVFVGEKVAEVEGCGQILEALSVAARDVMRRPGTHRQRAQLAQGGVSIQVIPRTSLARRYGKPLRQKGVDENLGILRERGTGLRDRIDNATAARPAGQPTEKVDGHFVGPRNVSALSASQVLHMLGHQPADGTGGLGKQHPPEPANLRRFGSTGLHRIQDRLEVLAPPEPGADSWIGIGVIQNRPQTDGARDCLDTGIRQPRVPTQHRIVLGQRLNIDVTRIDI